MHEISLIPMEQLESVFFFIGIDQDRTKVSAFIHSAAAVAVFIFGIIYLRSRRLDILSTIFENQYDSEGESEAIPKLKVSKPATRFKSMPGTDDIDEPDSSFAEDEDEQQYLIWKIYDKLIDAFTSEFVVLNICRLGLCVWILRYNCIQSIIIVIFLFHSTLIKSMVAFLPFIKFFYLPYM